MGMSFGDLRKGFLASWHTCLIRTDQVTLQDFLPATLSWGIWYITDRSPTSCASSFESSLFI